MSEYQYYEFLAIDRPLTEEEMDELRALSTRAAITPVSFTNEYNWGNFKGDPYKLMQRHFDAHVYVANWMTAIFMVRLPIEALTREVAKSAAVPYLLDIKSTSTHWIITWSLEESENYDRFGMEDGRGWPRCGMNCCVGTYAACICRLPHPPEQCWMVWTTSWTSWLPTGPRRCSPTWKTRPPGATWTCSNPNPRSW
jgi:hypothetical protein